MERTFVDRLLWQMSTKEICSNTSEHLYASHLWMKSWVDPFSLSHVAKLNHGDWVVFAFKMRQEAPLKHGPVHDRMFC